MLITTVEDDRFSWPMIGMAVPTHIVVLLTDCTNGVQDGPVHVLLGNALIQGVIVPPASWAPGLLFPGIHECCSVLLFPIGVERQS